MALWIIEGSSRGTSKGSLISRREQPSRISQTDFIADYLNNLNTLCTKVLRYFPDVFCQSLRQAKKK